MKHRGASVWQTWLCALRHGGRHPFDCGYAPGCDGSHVCTDCGWDGQV